MQRSDLYSHGACLPIMHEKSNSCLLLSDTRPHASQVAADNGILDNTSSRARRHAWIIFLDMDEYITPMSPVLSLPDVLHRYEQEGKYNLILQKVWFGSGSPASEGFIQAPLLARFTHYGTELTKQRYGPTRAQRKGMNNLNNLTEGGKSANTLHVNWGAAKPAFSTRVMPTLTLDPKGASQLFGTHCITGLLSRASSASHRGESGLVLVHFKPQSQEEFLLKIAWNTYLQHKEALGKSSGTTQPPNLSAAMSKFATMRLHTSGGTHAIFLDRLPQLCRKSPSIKGQLQKCNMSTACLDCMALKQMHGGATDKLEVAGRRTLRKAAQGVVITGAQYERVVRALQRTGFGYPFMTRDDNASHQGLETWPVVHTDTTDAALINSLPCERLSFLDPSLLDDETISSRVHLIIDPDKLAFPLKFPLAGVPCTQGNPISSQRLKSRRTKGKGKAVGVARSHHKRSDQLTTTRSRLEIAPLSLP